MDSKDRKKLQESQEEPVPEASPIDHSTTLSPAYDATGQKPRRTAELDFSELEDGSIVEMIENPHDATKSLLAIWNNGQVRYAEKVKHGDQVLVPLPRDTGMIRRVRLATGTETARMNVVNIVNVENAESNGRRPWPFRWQAQGDCRIVDLGIEIPSHAILDLDCRRSNIFVLTFLPKIRQYGVLEGEKENQE